MKLLEGLFQNLRVHSRQHTNEAQLHVTYTSKEAIVVLNWCLMLAMDWKRVKRQAFNPNKMDQGIGIQHVHE